MIHMFICVLTKLWRLLLMTTFLCRCPASQSLSVSGTASHKVVMVKFAKFRSTLDSQWIINQGVLSYEQLFCLARVTNIKVNFNLLLSITVCMTDKCFRINYIIVNVSRTSWESLLEKIQREKIYLYLSIYLSTYLSIYLCIYIYIYIYIDIYMSILAVSWGRPPLLNF